MLVNLLLLRGNGRMKPAWSGLALNVQVATTLNRTQRVAGRRAWLLPCLGRIEIDRQDGHAQACTTEDSTSKVPAARSIAVTLHWSSPSAAELEHAVSAGDQIG